MNDIPHRELGDFSRHGARQLRHGDDQLRHMVRAGVGADAGADGLLQVVAECDAVAQFHKQDDAHVGSAVSDDILPDDQTLEHFRDLLHLPVDLRRANAHAAGVERGVAAAEDHQAVV